jgi:hypothetical protein
MRDTLDSGLPGVTLHDRSEVAGALAGEQMIVAPSAPTYTPDVGSLAGRSRVDDPYHLSPDEYANRLR